MHALHWQSEKIYYDQQDYFDDILESIGQAHHTIEVETYIFQSDRLGHEVLKGLIAAADRGVRVRVIVDGVGSFFWIPDLVTALLSSKVQLKEYHPFLFPLATKWKWLRIDLIMRAFSQLNKRLHRKIFIIDNNTLFVGSFNITNRSNRDTGVRVTGNQIQDLLECFEEVWCSNPRLRKKKLTYNFASYHFFDLHLNNTVKMRKLCNRDLAYHIRLAQDRVWITNAYFVPPLFILSALSTAKKHGADVRLLLPARSDMAFMKLLTETYYRGLLQLGVRIFEYQNHFLHAKTLLIDNWATVGSSNMNHRSLFHDLEVDVVLTQVTSLKSLEMQFANDQENSLEITIDQLSRQKYLNRFIGWLLYLFRYWL